MMIKVRPAELKKYLILLFSSAGLNNEDSNTVADVYTRATLRGVGHHDVYDVPSRIESLVDGKINVAPAIRLMDSYGALERYDGDNAFGEICSSFITDRAMDLAEEHGISFCTVKNSNHFLSSAPYIEKAAEKGFLAIIFSRTNPVMHAPDTKEKIIGNSPIGFAVNTDDGFPIMLDICLAYSSNGQLNAKMENGESVPPYWGIGSDGNPTSNPEEIMKGGTPSPIAGYKGFGLSILTEVLTGVMSGGEIIDERLSEHKNGFGVYSQSVIAIRTNGLVQDEMFTKRTSEIISRMKNIDSNVRIPGHNSYTIKEQIINDDSLQLSVELIAKLNKLSKKLGIDELSIEK